MFSVDASKRGDNYIMTLSYAGSETRFYVSFLGLKEIEIGEFGEISHGVGSNLFFWSETMFSVNVESKTESWAYPVL
ncbi:Hypothetical protein HVR_LOCUS921 [uncultured virus]|nr:Hypothetical protein HVR_LOCUS921 [uncultured virus]